MISSGNRLSDAFVQWVKDSLRMDERVQAIILAYEYRAIKAVMRSIARFEHGAIAGESAIHTNKWELVALAAWSGRI